MAVTPKTRVTLSAMTALANLANTKTSLTDKPFRFLPPITAVANETGMLNCWTANLGEAPGGIAVRSDEKKAYQLNSAAYGGHKIRANWIEHPMLVFDTFAQMNSSPGTSGQNAFVIQAGAAYRWASNNRWISTSWRLELKRLRASLSALRPINLGGSGFSYVERDEELWFEPGQYGFHSFSPHRYAFNYATSDWPSGLPLQLFRKVSYVFPDNAATVVTVSALIVLSSAFALNTTKSWTIRLRGSFSMPPRIRFRLQCLGRNSTGDQFAISVSGSGAFLITRILYTSIDSAELYCDDVEWGGGDADIVITIGSSHNTENPESFNVQSIGADDQIYWSFSNATAAQAIHGTSNVSKIDLPTGSAEFSSIGFWFRRGVIDPPPGFETRDRWVWGIKGHISARPVAGALNGFMSAEAIPLVGVDPDETAFDPTPDPGSDESILARYAKHNYTAVQGIRADLPIGEVYKVSQLIDYKVPRVYFRRDTDNPNTVKLAMFEEPANRIRVGATIYQVTVKRLPDPGDEDATPQVSGPVKLVRLGCIRNGNFHELTGVIISAGTESTTFQPDWIDFTQDSLCYSAAGPERYDVQAMIVLPNPHLLGFSYRGVGVFTDMPDTIPVMAFHYNDTESLLNQIA